MTRMTIQEYAAALRSRYQAAGRRDKKRMLDEFCQTTGLHRKSAIRLLNRELRPRLAQTGRPKRYGPEVLEPLRLVWETGDRMCGKLLVAVMPTLVAVLERYGELHVGPEVRELLLRMSASTIDRLLNRQSIRLSNRRPQSHPRPAKP